MKLYNTLKREIEDFKPLGEVIKIYSCGPTVYDHIHIGNLSSFIFADTLRRVLSVSSQKVEHVMNFTDVDDKTIKRSAEKYADLEAMEALLKLTGEYSKVFLEDMKAVGNDVEVMKFIKATDSIPAMRDLIKQLRQDGFAYLADDGVYFSIEAYKKSGKKYGQLTDITASSTSEARIQNDEYDKESVHDFALWKKQKPGEPAWDFELDGQNLRGRPGWHIECSAMSKSLLGQPFDIHTGGVDLIFPHHENEIAQSTAGNDDRLANYFVHNEHLLIDGQKMSKSLDNFYTLEDIRKKGFDPLAFRLLVLQAHYRKQAHFSWENLEAAQNRLKAFRAMADLRFQIKDFNYDEFDAVKDSNIPAEYPISNTEFDRIIGDVHETLQQSFEEFATEDISTPKILAVLSEIEEQANLRLIARDTEEKFSSFLDFIDGLLGLDLTQSLDITADQQEVISMREDARGKKDWTESDKLRDQLKSQGIGVRDTVFGGSIWFRL